MKAAFDPTADGPFYGNNYKSKSGTISQEPVFLNGRFSTQYQSGVQRFAIWR